MIRRMRPSDVAGLMQLKAAAGWNQLEHDWLTVMAVEPEGCWVDERDGQVAGSVTAVRYGSDLAWIGMMLVLPAFRRQGIGRALMRHVIAWLEDCGVERIGLDATDMGKPLYESLGFTANERIVRFHRPGKTSPREHPLIRGGEPIALDVDRAAFGADRARLLHTLAQSWPDDTIAATNAFLFSRPGANARFMGPIVATSHEVAEELIREALARHGAEDLFWDVLTDQAEAMGIALASGFLPSRTLARMVRKRNPSRPWITKYAWVYGAAGFEYG